MGELHISEVVDRRGVAADDVLDVLRARIHDSRLLSHKRNVQREVGHLLQASQRGSPQVATGRRAGARLKDAVPSTRSRERERIFTFSMRSIVPAPKWYPPYCISRVPFWATSFLCRQLSVVMLSRWPPRYVRPSGLSIGPHGLSWGSGTMTSDTLVSGVWRDVHTFTFIAIRRLYFVRGCFFFLYFSEPSGFFHAK